MSFTTSSPSRAIPRSSSIDSAISTVSAQSHTNNFNNSNNAFPQVTGSSPADVQTLIQAAGSAEELIRYMLKEKQSVTAQNSQLWRLVDKQRAMILGLNKDLERAMREKDRYRTKLKEHMGMIPPLPTPSSTGASLSRALNDSYALSLDESQSRSESPPRGNGVARTESTTSGDRDTDRDREDLTVSTLDVVITPYPVFQSPVQSERVVSNVTGGMRSPMEHARHSPPRDRVNHSHGTNARDELPTIDFRVVSPEIHRLHDDDDDERIELSRAVPHSAKVREQLHEDLPRLQIEAEPLSPEMKLGSPVSGLGKSPMRKAPPAPLEISHSQLQKSIQLEEEDDDRDYARPSAGGSENSWQSTPDDKKALSVPRLAFMGNGPLTAPPTRPAPAPYFHNAPLTPNPSSQEMAQRFSPDAEAARIRATFVRAPLPSPGLPSSPRPVDRPANSPMPRASRNFSLDGAVGIPGSPKPAFHNMTIPSFNAGTPRSSMPLTSPRAPFFSGHERAGSEGSTLAAPNQKSPSTDQVNLMILPSAIAYVDSRVVSSRMKPSRASMLPGRPRPSSDDSVFTLGVFSRADGKEILRVEKDVGALPALDVKLSKYISYTVKVPERALFTGYAPARVDARRAAIDEYFAGVMGATMDERAALALCEFFSTDVVEHYPSSTFKGIKESPETTEKQPIGSTVVKQGYLTKRGKNFGGWKERYFVLDGPVLKYFDAPGGAQLGQIKLQNSQIGRQSASQKAKDDANVDEDSQYRHAFLVLEPKRKDSTTLVRHVLCAENDKERDEWVSGLLDFVTTDKEEDGKRKLRHAMSKESKEIKESGGGKESKEAKDGSDDGKTADDSSLRSMSYEEVSQGPAPARGPTPEELGRQISLSPSLLAQPPSQFSSHSPVPDRGHPPKQISAPSGGSVISDLSAWGASKSKHEDKKAEKAAKKRSIWGFRQRASSDADDQIKNGNQQTGYQQAAERFPLSRTVFGASLEEAVYLTKPPGVDVSLPAVVYRCIEYLEAKNASEEEGIFRLSGSNVVIRGLKERFNTESDFNILAHDEYYDVHAIAGLLKLYLRELPTSVLTSERRDDFVKVTEMEDKNQKVSTLNNLVHSLPVENFALLKALSGHLLKIVDNAAINLMTIRNVGIVFSPTLNIPAQVFSMFLHEYRYIFFRDGEVPPLSPSPRSPKHTFDSSGQSRASLSIQRTMEPPSTPMLPSHPATIRPPGSQPQIVAYEPTYEQQPRITSPTQISAPRFNTDMHLGGDSNNIQPGGSSSNLGGGLTVPDTKITKTRRRESSMMFMIGGLKKSTNAFQPSKSNAMVEEDLYG